MPNWDDQFDFQDINEPKKNNKNSKQANKKKTTNDDDDFFELDDGNTKKQPKSILPTINPRQSANLKSDKNINSLNNNKYNPYADKVFGKNANKSQEFEDYYEEDIAQEEEPKPNYKVNQKNQIEPPKNNNKSIKENESKLSNNYDQEFYEDLEEPLQQFDQKTKSKLKNNENENSNISQKKNSVLTNKDNNQIHSKTKGSQKQEENYDDQFENEEYNDDEFQDEVKSPIKNQSKQINPKKNNLTSSNNSNNQKESKSIIPPKPPGQPSLPQRKNPKTTTVSNTNLNKIQSRSVNKKMVRNNSRQSIRSTDSRKVGQSRIKNDSQYFPNKHSDMVERSFPHDESRLTSLNQAEINKINEKMRAMIRKFNEQLNDLINKNMLLLKNKNNSKQQSVEDRIRELQIQRKTGQTAIDVMEKQFDKLQGRQGQLKQQEYQLILQKRIDEKKQQIKQITKQITEIKRQVDTKGKKLSVKEQQKKDAQSIHHLKTVLIQAKKDQEKGEERIQKLITNQEELQTKLSDLEYKLDEVISQAREKGISIENQDHLIKKYEQNKKKLQNIKNFNKKSEGLINTKVDILNHQNQQIRITIRNIFSQINNLYGSIDHSQSQSIKLIQKAKNKQGISPVFAQSLDKLLKQIEESKANNDYYEVRSEVKSRRSSTSKRPLKNSNTDNIEKSTPVRSTHVQNKLEENQENTIIKPKFIKKKNLQQGRLEIQNKIQEQRVWNQQQENKNIKQTVQKQTPQTINQSVPIIQEKKDKSKPFSLKKYKVEDKNQSQGTVQVKKQQVAKQNSLNLKLEEGQKKEQTPNINIAPRMMRFGRKKNQQNKNDISINQNHNAPSQSTPVDLKSQEMKNPTQITNNKQISLGQEPAKLQIKEEIKKDNQQVEKPIFVPKRFNLRNRGLQKKEDSYMPSVQTNNDSIQQSNEKIPSPKKQTPAQEYKPKFDFKNEQLTKAKEEPKVQQQIKSILSEENDIKPKFNLRLRDRMKKNETNQTDSYMPSLNSNKNLNDENRQNNNNHSYAPKNNLESQINTKNIKNPYAPKNDFISSPNTNSNSVAQQPNKQPINNPYAPKEVTNPYLPDSNNGTKAEKVGPLKRNNKISANNLPKQKINIYDQAEDLTSQVNEFGATKINGNNSNVNQNNPYIPSNNSNSNNKSQQLDLNAMLGIKKEAKKNDFDDLLGDVGAVGKKTKKKNNDFFGDLEL